ncbi:MAG TPA: hypothetical protein VIK53_03135 [Verrucomicrobiae bacterium]
MPLPDFNANGDLPPGVHRAAWTEVIVRFGGGGQRDVCARRLSHVHELARRTGCLQRFVIFGSYVTAKTNPNDVDVILIMDDSFRLENCPMESRALFDYAVRLRPVGQKLCSTFMRFKAP